MTGMIERLPNPRTLTALTRMTIEHSTGEYLINEMPVDKARLDACIMLGAVRQRVMFTPRDESGSGGGQLECRSSDFAQGKPTPLFAKEESNFPAWSIEEAQTQPDSFLACGACAFAQWKTDERGKKIHSRCIPQIAVPVLIPDVNASAPFTFAVVSYQRSAEQPITEYMKEFTKANKPAYTAITQLRLNLNLGSGFKYSTPKFTNIANVGEEFWPALSSLYRASKAIIQTPPAPPPPRGTGGMLSVGSSAEVAAPTYTGGFFS